MPEKKKKIPKSNQSTFKINYEEIVQFGIMEVVNMFRIVCIELLSTYLLKLKFKLKGFWFLMGKAISMEESFDIQWLLPATPLCHIINLFPLPHLHLRFYFCVFTASLHTFSDPLGKLNIPTCSFLKQLSGSLLSGGHEGHGSLALSEE